MPHSPCLRNFQGLANTVSVLGLLAMSLLRFNPPGNCLPSSLSSSGLGSQRSMWLGPPCIQSEIMAVARGSRCGGLGVRS